MGGYFANVRRRSYGIGPLEIIAIAIGLVAVVYTGWVIKDVSTSGPDEGSDLSRRCPRARRRRSRWRRRRHRPSPADLEPFTDAASEARTILVIGDSTGVGPGAWVDLVAQDLGADRQVALHEWDEDFRQFDQEATTYGEVGDPLDIWNLSYQGVDADYPERMGALPEPDVVLVNVGHDRSPRAVERAVLVTTEAVGERWGDVPTALHPAEPLDRGRRAAAGPSDGPAHHRGHGDRISGRRRLRGLRAGGTSRRSSTTSPGPPTKARASGPTWWARRWPSGRSERSRA